MEGNLKATLKTFVPKSYNSKKKIQMVLRRHFLDLQSKIENGKFISGLLDSRGNFTLRIVRIP